MLYRNSHLEAMPHALLVRMDVVPGVPLDKRTGALTPAKLFPVSEPHQLSRPLKVHVKQEESDANGYNGNASVRSREGSSILFRRDHIAAVVAGSRTDGSVLYTM